MLKDLFKGFLNLLYPPTLTPNALKTPPSSIDFVYLQTHGITLNPPPFCIKSSRYHFDFAWGAYLYNDALRDMIHAFKYHQKTLYRHFFSRLMIHFIDHYNLDIHQFDMVVPIPLFPARFRERGYNQSQLLAEKIGNHYNIYMNRNIIFKSRPTRNQAGLKQKDRFTNIQGAFKINTHLNIEKTNILLIDDILTTGATASEAAKTLKEAGANTVGVFTLAIG